MNPEGKNNMDSPDFNIDISLDKNREIDPEKYRFKLKKRKSHLDVTQVITYLTIGRHPTRL